MTEYEKIDKVIDQFFGPGQDNGQYILDRGDLHAFAHRVTSLLSYGAISDLYDEIQRIGVEVKRLRQNGDITWEQYTEIVK